MKNLIFILPIIIIYSCSPQSPNVDYDGEDIITKHIILDDEIENLVKFDTVYVPIYSDIYSGVSDTKYNLTATLSIRNTSLLDTLYINDIDYYDTHGELVKEFTEHTLMLVPMESIDYVIEEEDVSGGTGANFIVNWAAKTTAIKPIFQGVMISTRGQQGISFLTNGISISRE